MSNPSGDSQNQISFGQELLRKGTHTGGLIIPGSYFFFGLDKFEMLTIMVPFSLLMILVDFSRLRNWSFWTQFASKIAGKMVRNHEAAGDFLGSTYILASICVTIALYDKPIAIAALAFIMVGDSMAAIIGRKFGRHKFGRKSVEGSLACLAGTLAVAWLVPGILFPVAITGAVVATLVEALSIGVDDNVSVPIISGLVMTIMTKIIASNAIFV